MILNLTTYNYLLKLGTRYLTRKKKVITVIDKSDFTLVLQGLVYFDEIEINGVEDMVEKIIMRAETIGTIYLLNIEGHGNMGYQAVGLNNKESINYQNLPTHEQVLKKLKPYFRSDATVILHGCKVGASFEGYSLLQRLAKIWGVSVKAGVINQKLPPGLEGDIHHCTPVKCELKKAEP